LSDTTPLAYRLRILSADAVLAIVRKVYIVAEAVRTTKLQTAYAWASLLDRVVNAERIVRIVIVVRVRKQVTAPVAPT
jgi:hypothetical protein